MKTLFSKEELDKVEKKPTPEEPIEMPVAQHKLPREIVDFSSLTEFEQKVLALRAYIGGTGDSGKFKILANRNNLTMSEMSDIGMRICQKGFFEYAWGFKGNFNNYEIKPIYVFQIIFLVLDCHPEWMIEFKTFAKRSDSAKKIWTVMQNLYDGRTDLIEKHQPFPFYEKFRAPIYYQHLIRYPFFAPYLKLVPSEDLVNVVGKSIDADISDDNMSVERLQTYEKIAAYIGNRKERNALILKNMVRVYQFLCTGVLHTEDLHGMTENCFAAKAIQMLYKGDIEQSKQLFEEALTMHNEVCSEKNIFFNPVLTFFLILFYYKKAQTPALKKKVAAIARKRYLSDHPVMYGATFAAHHLILHDRAEVRKEDLLDLKATKLPLCKQFYQLFAALFADDSGCKPIKDLQPSTCALLRYEQSRFMAVPDAAQLEQVLGGKPLLHSAEHKAAWEVVFEELIGGNKVQQEKATDKTIPDRVAYIGGGESWMPQRQRWLKSGRWSSPSQIGIKNFLRCDVDCMSGEDRQIANSLHKYDTYWMEDLFTAEHLFPYLIGKDCVYYHRYQSEPLQQVEIREEKPFLNVERGKKGFVITSNVGLVDGKSMVQKNDDTHYSVFRFSDYEYTAFQRILSLGIVPLGAEEMLRKYLSELSRRIEIHSELIEGGSSLEQAEASSQIILRLHPDAEQFVLQVLVQPLAGGDVEVVPATGDAVMYAAKEGKRYQVNRNLRQEKNNLHELEEYLYAHLNVSLEKSCAVLSLEQLLPLLEFATANDERFAVEWPQDYRINLRTFTDNQAGEIRLKKKENWLEIEGELQLNEQEVMSYAELLRLMSDGKVGGRFVRLQNGDFLALSEHISKQLNKLEQLTQFDHKKARIPVYQVGSLARLLQNGNGMVADKSLKELVRHVEEAAITDFAMPKGLRTELRDYQQDGYQWMMRLAAWGANGCLADDMGLGKTIQAMAFMLHYAAEGVSLVVAPASVVFNWEQELLRFAPALHPVILNDAEDRAATINNLKPYDILLTTYGLLVREQEALAQRKWNIICLDEAHTIKNRQTKMSQAAMSLQSVHRLMLTGTPVQNNLSELWNLFQFLNPGLLGSFEQFTKRFIQPIEQQHDKQQQQVLHRLVQPFILRRTKAEVVDELPEKVEITRKVTLSDAERMHYEALRLNAQKEVEEAERVDVKLLSMITRLRLAACSPELVNPEWTEGSQKIDELMSLLSQIVDGGNTVLVFSQFTSFLKIVEKRLNASEHKTAYLYLDGSTPLAKRKQMVEQFQRGEVQVFLISLKAGGLGLNLTAANYVIHLDPWWNPAIEQQATDRAYRIGQHQNITVYHLVAANTIEEKILRLHKTKRDLADALLQDQNTAHTLTIDDLKMLVQET